MIRLAVALVVAIAALGCSRPRPAPAPAPPVASAAAAPGLHFDVGALDRRVDPCGDFYEFACGGWRATHPIPADQTRWSRYAEIGAVNRERVRSIVEEAAHRSASPAEQRVGAYYAACMDQPGIDARGLAPVKELLARIDAIRGVADLGAVVRELHAHGIYALFDVYPETDPGDARRQVPWIDSGALGLPDPAAYSQADEAAAALRGKYADHLGRLFQLLGATPDEAKASAARVLAFETSLAAKALSAVERRKRELQEHPMTLAELGQRFPSIDWLAELDAIGAPAALTVNVAQPAWLAAVDAALASDLAGARDELRMLLVRFAAPVLPSAIDREVFDFNRRILRGVREMPPRWKRCLDLVDRDAGADVGRIFVARYFKDDARARVKAMIDALVGAYRADIASCDWLGESARAAATAKLEGMLIVTGASNRLRSLDGLRTDASDPFGNVWRARALAIADEMSAAARVTDRERFFQALPQELDGFGSKSLNATGFTAGFLQPPVFDPQMDDAVNYGGLGGVIGHELTHRFDDEGRKYDADGNLRSWWSDDDVARFEERARCFVDEYARFQAEDGTPVDGKLTLGENIADNGGLRLSYAALRPSDAGPAIDGFTPAQRFFLAWAQIRCENVTPEAARLQAKSDPHSPGRARANGVVANMPEFARAFHCPAGAPMAPEKRCVLW